MPRKTRPFAELRMQRLADPDIAAEYLNLAIEESLESFLKALRNVAQARQMAKVAKESGVQRETLYRSLSEQGNPTLETLSSVLAAVGMGIRVEPERKPTVWPPPKTNPEVTKSAVATRTQETCGFSDPTQYTFAYGVSVFSSVACCSGLDEPFIRTMPRIALENTVIELPRTDLIGLMETHTLIRSTQIAAGA